MISERLQCTKLLDKVCTASEAAFLIPPKSVVGTSGFTPAGYPKALPLALAKRQQAGENLRLTVITGASVGPEIDRDLLLSGAIERRYPYQTTDAVRQAINNGQICYADMHLSHTPQWIQYGFFGEMDFAIIEAIAITEEGAIVPSTSVGNSPTFVHHAKQVIIEINTSQPLKLMGLHDIYQTEKPPHRKPLPLTEVRDRIGTPFIPCDIEKIAAIVFTDIPDSTREVTPIDDISQKISQHLIEFLAKEVRQGRLPEHLLPIQSGIGSVANAVLGGLCTSDFEDLTVYSEVLQDSVLDLIDCGKVTMASGTAITLSPQRLGSFYQNIDRYKDKLILRPQEISNHPEIIRRLGIISINTAIEADIYGNVNSTHIMGSRMMNGIGGSGDFTRNAYLSIFTTESIAKGGKISSIVPMVSHHDHTEHDVMVLVTEQGISDLRGLSPRERAESIIENCAHPDYRNQLRMYFEAACQNQYKHTPHDLSKALSWHQRFLGTGSM